MHKFQGNCDISNSAGVAIASSECPIIIVIIASNRARSNAVIRCEDSSFALIFLFYIPSPQNHLGDYYLF